MQATGVIKLMAQPSEENALLLVFRNTRVALPLKRVGSLPSPKPNHPAFYLTMKLTAKSEETLEKDLAWLVQEAKEVAECRAGLLERYPDFFTNFYAPKELCSALALPQQTNNGRFAPIRFWMNRVLGRT